MRLVDGPVASVRRGLELAAARRNSGTRSRRATRAIELFAAATIEH